MNREPVVLWSSILVTLQVVVAGSVLTDVLGANIAALVALIVAALQAGTQFYVRSLVTPTPVLPRDQRGAGDVASALLIVFIGLAILLVLSWLVR